MQLILGSCPVVRGYSGRDANAIDRQSTGRQLTWQAIDIYQSPQLTALPNGTLSDLSTLLSFINPRERCARFRGI